jgi:putative molybdopterin biosynthesis protein
VAASRQLHLRLLLGEAIGTALGLGYEASELEAAFIGQLAVWREERAGRVRSEAGRPSARQRRVRIGGSHDLGLELLGAQLRAAPHPVRLHMELSSSLGGLFALANGDCDLAGCHLRDEASGELNVPFVRSVLPGRSVDLVTLAEREQGLMLAATNPLGIAGVADLARAEIRFVNRQRGAGTRLLLDHQLRLSGVRSDQVNGYLREEPSHIAVASAVATGAADVGLGIRAAAEALGLGFIPLARERYELALLSAAAERPAIRRVLETLRSRDFKAALRALAGYATHDTGQTRTVS